MKVFFIGAGPGDPELITVKGLKILQKADIVIYAGSLVSPEILKECHSNVTILDSASMNLKEVSAVYRERKDQEGIIVRLHTGDPSVYGAIQEQMDLLDQWGISYKVIPGVSSFQASSAALKQQLTLPGVSQTVILTRISGRTKTPELEDLELLSRSKSTMVLFLSVDQAAGVQEKLLPSYGPETPVAVVYRASWTDEKIVRGTLGRLSDIVKDSGITRQALIFVGDVLDSEYEKSKLYDAAFTHGYREAVQ
jgi:precorrin-4/cobalt-precorrin-4 C11-methyltransferase